MSPETRDVRGYALNLGGWRIAKPLCFRGSLRRGSSSEGSDGQGPIRLVASSPLSRLRSRSWASVTVWRDREILAITLPIPSLKNLSSRHSDWRTVLGSIAVSAAVSAGGKESRRGGNPCLAAWGGAAPPRQSIPMDHRDPFGSPQRSRRGRQRPTTRNLGSFSVWISVGSAGSAVKDPLRVPTLRWIG